MKSNLLRSVLEWALITSLLLSVYFLVKYYFQSKQQRMFAGEVQRWQNNRNMLQILGSEGFAYSQKDPSIIPVLEAAGISLKTNAAPGGKPAMK